MLSSGIREFCASPAGCCAARLPEECTTRQRTRSAQYNGHHCEQIGGIAMFIFTFRFHLLRGYLPKVL